MISPHCPDHGRLVLDLALGRLDDAAAFAAESISESCPVCREWWHEQFGTEAAAVLDETVAATFSDLQLPARRRGYRWLAAAAAAVMTLGVGTIWLVQGNGSPDEVAAPRVASIAAITFEAPDLTAEFVLVEAPDADTPFVEHSAAEESPVKEARNIKAASADVVAGQPTVVLFAGGFESGGLEDWVPAT